jgi:hypothetical protein
LRMNQDNIENGIQRCVIHVKRVGVRLSVVVKERVMSLLHVGNISAVIRGAFKGICELLMLAIHARCGYTF